MKTVRITSWTNNHFIRIVVSYAAIKQNVAEWSGRVQILIILIKSLPCILR